MDLTTTLFLATDGLTNGAVYTLVGLSLVLVTPPRAWSTSRKAST